uniref:Uncharacterized protein n=1 Tax=Lygus hesperus TaxID=30085 RepID=A0A0K8TFM4_LYGHE
MAVEQVESEQSPTSPPQEDQGLPQLETADNIKQTPELSTSDDADDQYSRPGARDTESVISNRLADDACSVESDFSLCEKGAYEARHQLQEIYGPAFPGLPALHDLAWNANRRIVHDVYVLKSTSVCTYVYVLSLRYLV